MSNDLSASWQEFLDEVKPAVEVLCRRGLTPFQALLLLMLEGGKNEIVAALRDNDDDEIEDEPWKIR